MKRILVGLVIAFISSIVLNAAFQQSVTVNLTVRQVAVANSELAKRLAENPATPVTTIQRLVQLVVNNTFEGLSQDHARTLARQGENTVDNLTPAQCASLQAIAGLEAAIEQILGKDIC